MAISRGRADNGTALLVPGQTAKSMNSRQKIVTLEMDALKRLQAEAAKELDALLPAILDRAFKGEL